MAMKCHILILLVASVIYEVHSAHMVLGETLGREVIHHTSVQYPGVQNLRRLKYVVYTNLELRPIKGIEAHDNMESQAHSNVIAGGIGFTFATIRLKSERGKGLDYDVKIYG